MYNSGLPPTKWAIRITDENGVEHIPYDPGHNPKQLEYHSRIEPNVLFYGGRGSGKSICGRWDAHMRAMATPGLTYIVLRRTHPELQRSHLLHVPREMKLLGGDFNMTEKVARYPNGSRGFYSHCATEEDVLNLLSAEFGLAFFDELSTFPWEMFTKLAASVRAPIGSGIIPMVRAATNPLGPSAEQIMQYFVHKNVDLSVDPDYLPDDWYAIKANAIDNAFIDAEQYRKRFSGLPEHVRKAWIDGDFALENALFTFSPTRDSKPYHVINEINIPELVKAGRIYRAFDWGWFPDPSYCLWIAHIGNRYIAFHEKMWYQTTAPEIAAEIKEIDRELGIEHVVSTFCDPSIDVHHGNICTTKDLFEIHGVPMDNSVNNREMAATVLHRALGEEALPGVPKLQIYDGVGGCHYLVKSIPQMRYDSKNPLSIANHRDDHPVITLGYYLMSNLAMDAPPASRPGQLPRWMQPKKSDRLVLGNENVRSSRFYS